MNIYYGLESLPHPPWEATSITIGVFDGVHVGHQQLIRATLEKARQEGIPALVLTFDVHPQEVLRPDQAPDYLCTLQHRLERFSDLGVDQVLIARFDRAFAEFSAEEFVQHVLVHRLRARHVTAGPDFRFGHGRQGDVEFLQAMGNRFGFETHVLAPITDPNGVRISSTYLRQLVRAGAVEEAQHLLGEPLTWTGTVVRGNQWGSSLGFPTANLKPVARLVTPAEGVYVARARFPQQWYWGALSIGMKPTFASVHPPASGVIPSGTTDEVTPSGAIPSGATTRVVPTSPFIEIYLLDFPYQSLYGRTLHIQIVAYLRAQQRFDSLEALRDQIARDVEQVRKLMG